jgi:ribosomal protein L29
MAKRKSGEEILTEIAALKKELEQERALNASLNRYIEALEGKAEFQNEIRKALHKKIARLEHKEDGP